MRSIVFISAVIAALTVAACGSDSKSAPAPSAKATTPTTTAAKSGGNGAVAVTLKEFTLVSAPATADVGSVVFTVQNAGKLKHEFVVVKTAKSPAGLLKGDEADETGAVGEIGDLPAGATKKLTLMLKPGHYVLLCNVAGHFKAGQRADFSVR